MVIVLRHAPILVPVTSVDSIEHVREHSPEYTVINVDS